MDRGLRSVVRAILAPLLGEAEKPATRRTAGLRDGPSADPIPVCAGDPADGPASFVRFVLPFGYQLEEGGSPDGPAWRPAPQEERQRRRQLYFTAETAQVLFRRTERLELDLPDESRRFEVPHRKRGGTYVVGIAAPRLLLFEWPGSPKTDFEPDLLATGFLFIDLFFPESGRAPDLDEVLELSEVFRHCVPPFSRHAESEPDGSRRGYLEVLGDLSIDMTRAEGPRVRDVAGTSVGLLGVYFDRWASLLQRPLEPSPGERWNLFPRRWVHDAANWYGKPLADQGSGWVVNADSRAFVWTCALVEEGLAQLHRRFDSEVAEASSFGHWVKLLNVDAPGMRPEEVSTFEREWAKERTYRRWEHRETAYGFAYHGAALLGPPRQEPPIWLHFRDEYFDQTLLLLYLRVTSFRFSSKLTEITSGARGAAEEVDEWRRSFRALRRDCAFFTNLYQFPLVTNQQQGVEMYEIARKHLDVDELFREVQSEIQATDDFFAMEAAQRQSREALRLTLVANAGLLFSIVVGFFGMNILVPTDRSFSWELTVFGLVTVITWLLLGFVSVFTEHANRMLRLFKKDKDL